MKGKANSNGLPCLFYCAARAKSKIVRPILMIPTDFLRCMAKPHRTPPFFRLAASRFFRILSAKQLEEGIKP